MHVHVPDAQWGQTTSVWSRERFIAGPSKNSWLMLKKPELPDGFQESIFIGKIWGEGSRVCDFLLIGQWWGSKVLLQESCAQPEVTILHLGRGLRSCKRTERYCYIYSLRRNKDPALYCFLIASPLFLHFLTSLDRKCLNLLFGTQGGLGGRSLFPTNKKRGDTERLLYPGGPHRVLPSFRN